MTFKIFHVIIFCSCNESVVVRSAKHLQKDRFIRTWDMPTSQQARDYQVTSLLCRHLTTLSVKVQKTRLITLKFRSAPAGRLMLPCVEPLAKLWAPFWQVISKVGAPSRQCLIICRSWSSQAHPNGAVDAWWMAITRPRSFDFQATRCSSNLNSRSISSNQQLEEMDPSSETRASNSNLRLSRDKMSSADKISYNIVKP